MIQLFGFKVHVGWTFVVFIGLLAFLYQSWFGIIFAIALTLFTLLHEFGHAVVARRFGAHAEISLGFMAGYTSYSMPGGGTLPAIKRALITASGPIVQIVVGIAVVIVAGALGSTGTVADVRVAALYAGPVIGVLNLIPVLPLDGGQLARITLSSLLKRDMTHPMILASLAITVSAVVYMYITGQRNYVFFVVLIGVAQFQMWQASSEQRAQTAVRPTGGDGPRLLQPRPNMPPPPPPVDPSSAEGHFHPPSGPPES